MYYVFCDDKLLDSFEDEGTAFSYLFYLKTLYEGENTILEIYHEEMSIYSEKT
jgi:hypothetical protein